MDYDSRKALSRERQALYRLSISKLLSRNIQIKIYWYIIVPAINTAWMLNWSLLLLNVVKFRVFENIIFMKM